MGNFAKEFYTLTIENKEKIKKDYFGIVEVVNGEFSQQRATKKYETHIEKALKYTLGKKILSHISLQTFPKWLHHLDKINRNEEDDRYYPFVLEFESSKAKDKYDVYEEAAVYVQYLETEFNINKDDIVITITNSKSVYVLVNPKSFGLVQGKNLHNIYTAMYKYFKNELGLKFVDESVTNSSYRLIKTPGTYYKGGYVVHITLEELTHLMVGMCERDELTKVQRNIMDLNVPSVVSLEMTRLYKRCKNEVEGKYKEINKEKTIKLPADKNIERKCVKKILDVGMIEKGNRNNLLVSLTIGLRDMGLTEKEIFNEVIRKALEWQHDESERKVKNKVKTLLRLGTRFSCEKAKGIFEEVGMDNACLNCSKMNSKGIWISRIIIDKLRINKGSVRHFEGYIKLEDKKLIGKQFTLEEVDIKLSTLKEITRKIGADFIKEGDIYTIVLESHKTDLNLPNDFLEKTFKSLKTNAKGFLFLLIKSCNGNSETAYVSMNLKTIAKYLGYENERSVYRFIKMLEDLGLLKVNKQQGVTLFFNSYKVISLKEYKISKTKVEIISYIIQNKRVVNSSGLQLNFKFENEHNNTNANSNYFKIGQPIKSENKNISRGSPP